MFVLERKIPICIKDPVRRSYVCQNYRWKTVALCKERQPLTEIIKKQGNTEDWRIEEWHD